MLGFAREDYVNGGFTELGNQIKQLAEMVQKQQKDSDEIRQIVLQKSTVDITAISDCNLDIKRLAEENAELREIFIDLLQLIEKAGLIKNPEPEPPKVLTPVEELAKIKEAIKKPEVEKSEEKSEPQFEDIGYCMRCKSKKKIVDVVVGNGLRGLYGKGRCEGCGQMLITRRQK